MKQNKNEIRKDFVKDSLLEYNNLANTLKENTESAVRDLLKETVLNTYAEILSEDKDEDYEVEKVEDTDLDTTNEDNDGKVEELEDTEAVDGMGSEDDESEEEVADVEETEADATDDLEDSSKDDSEEWSEFDKYKVDDDKYDFSDAEDEDIVKVYKLLKDDDQVVVVKDNGKVNIKDNETGAEYIIDMDGDDTDDSLPAEDFDNEENEENYMDESKIFEVVLNEYDSNVGYTDNYQDKDAMTTDGVDKEPGKNVNDWDKGVPHTNSKPWSGKKGDKSENQPFHAEKGRPVEEEVIDDSNEATVEEGAARFGEVQKHTKAKKHIGTNPIENENLKVQHSNSNSEDGYKADNSEAVKMESIMKKANKIFKENVQLKEALKKFRNTLEEAAVTNVNLGNIIKLISENTTSTDEKKMIIERFGKEANSLESSKNLYENISRELKKSQKMNIEESKQYAVNNQINEKQLYMSDDIMNTLDLMHRVCK